MNGAWERPPEYDDEPSVLDGCLGCGTCEDCISRSIVDAEEHDPTLKLRERVEELERALRYAAECSTLEMARDAARGMGVIG